MLACLLIWHETNQLDSCRDIIETDGYSKCLWSRKYILLTKLLININISSIELLTKTLLQEFLLQISTVYFQILKERWVGCASSSCSLLLVNSTLLVHHHLPLPLPLLFLHGIYAIPATALLCFNSRTPFLLIPLLIRHFLGNLGGKARIVAHGVESLVKILQVM